MKKRLCRLLAALLVAVLCFSLVACGGAEDDTTEPTGTQGSTTAPTGGTTAPDDDKGDATLSESLSTVKVGSVARNDFMVAKGGLYYYENGKYGLMSYVGLHDTGAVYAYVAEKGKYFAVTEKELSDSASIADRNSLSLVDGNGRVIASGHANYYLLDDRYAVASTVTGRCSKEEDAVASYRDGSVYLFTDSEYDMFGGSWCVYDLNTGKKVPGVTGTKEPNLLGYGNLFKCRMEDGTWVTYNCNGQVVEGRVFDDGSYSVEDEIGTVYASDGTKLFDYDLNGYAPTYLSADGNYYEASKYSDEDYTYTYAALDKTGKVVSQEYDTYMDVCGELLMVDGKVYNFAGDNIIEGEYDSLKKDAILSDMWLLRQGDTYIMMNTRGDVVFRQKTDDDHMVFTSEYVAYEKRNDGDYYYSHKDQDYTIKGYSFAPWLVKVFNDKFSICNLVDTISGKTVLEGYLNFSSNAYNGFAYYVYAKHEEGADVYLVVAGDQLIEIEQTKANLLTDLVAAFESEGIEVTIDKDTGAMSLDSDILFQANKSELSAEGKAELDKFLKAYSKVAFSDKYAGFINKTIIEGHIAPDGDSYASGLALSQERADVVLEYCLSAGNGDVAGSLQAVGYSNGQPVYNEDGSVNMEKSRRVSFRFMMNIEL